ncbi:MAG: hypothetical protein COV46_03060 [Deltaproteobacteria bacterium CG11_big_fil_rev_8_21_14_0_20_49_13]|nr:MAG: hypothetical protein COV46_03060 [Deltaproteobacteria bacterium CG11_big_fil_rev_8_21_14_0_20_49_13]
MTQWQANCIHPSIHPSIHPVGIPIGNLTSQFFANIYLNGLDHFIKEGLGCGYYLRYLDDFVVFHNDKKFLWYVKSEVEKYLETLKLKLHSGKCRIFKTESGVPFLGLTVFPNRRRLKRANVVRFKCSTPPIFRSLLFADEQDGWIFLSKRFSSF